MKDEKSNSPIAGSQDAAEHRQTEETLRKSEEHFRLLIERAPIGLAIIRGVDGAVEFSNDRFTQLFGYTSIDIPNIRDWWLFAYPEENYRQWVMDAWNAAVSRAAQNGTDIEGQQVNITCKNGAVRVVEISGISIGENFLVTFTDITERKRVEQELHEKQALLLEAQHIAHVSNWWHDLISGEVYWSDEFFGILGIDPQKPTTELALPLIHPDDLPVLLKAMAESTDGKVEHEHEFRIFRPDGEIRWIHNRWMALYDKDGKEIKRVGTHQDVTERKQAEEISRRMMERWSTIYRAGEEISASLDIEQVFQAVYRAVGQVMPCEDFLISMYDEDRNLMWGDYIIENGVRVASNPYQVDVGNKIAPNPYPATLGLGGFIVKTGQSVLLNSPQQIATSGINFVSYGSGPVTSSVLAVPLHLKDRIIGIVSAQSYSQDAYTSDDREMLAMLASHAAIAIDNAMLFEKAQSEIKERMQAEEKIRVSQEQLHAVIEGSRLGFSDWNIKTGVIQRNERWAEMLGFNLQEVESSFMQWGDLIHPDDRVSAMRALQDHLDGKTPIHRDEYRLRAKDGSYRWILDQGTIIEYDAQGQPSRMTATHTDITERKQAEEKVRQLNTELENRVEERTRELREAQAQLVRHEKLAVLGQMASSIGHELRNPLGVINSAVYYLKLVQPNADEKIRQYLGIIEQEVHTSEKIITDLLDFARIKSVDRVAVSVSELIHQTLARFPAPASVEVTVEIPNDLPQVYVDPRQIIQVLGNITLNACQAMTSPDGGALPDSNAGGQKCGFLSLHTCAQDDMINIVITDSGVGIPAENLNKIFEPLFTTKTRGVGLGLPVSQKLIQVNGGRIEVQSEAGKGSSFSVFLPIEKESK
ncbi:MAG: PAS domain-containing protein [Chloroflexi bacterium]|nr:PAS domain-containing protein [Chloroflexota bacterium]